MRKSFTSSIVRSLMGGLFGLTLAMAAGCGDSTDGCTTNADCGENQTCNTTTNMCEDAAACGDDCLSCRQDGECCDFSINCQGGSICNDPSEDLYDPDKEQGICIKVVCATNADCEAPKTCSLQKICEAPICQTDADCSGGNVCLGGSCTSAPNQADAASCQVLTGSAPIQESATLELAAVAKNQNGVVLPLIQFEWTSDNTGAVSISGNVATGGATSGAANVTAKVAGTSVSCTGTAVLRNFADPGTATRVIVADDGDGSPVAGAMVTIISGANTSSATTGSDGAATFAATGDPDSVTVTAGGYQALSVVSPGSKNLILHLPVVGDETKAGGFRGNIDISATKKADIKLGIAAPALPKNLLDFDFEALIGDFIPTVIDAEELGLDNEQVDLPGGIVLALSNNMFTDDSLQPGGGLRCQGVAPATGELGCYVARAPEGPGSAWALAGQLKLSDVTPIVSTLSSAFGGSGEDLPIGDVLTALLPLFQKLYHGINAGLFTDVYPTVPAPTGDACDEQTPCAAGSTCRMATGQCFYDVDCSNADQNDYSTKCLGDFSKYDEVELAANQDLGILSAVEIPTLPTLPSGKITGGAVLIGVAADRNRGIIPLGLSAGVDSADDEPQDGKVAGAEKPFGPESEPLDDGFMPLAMAPAHSGIEGSQIALIAFSLDPDTITAGIQLSGLITFKDRVNGVENFGSAQFMTIPEGTLSVANAQYTKTKGANDADFIRVELSRGGKTWLVYAPQSATITLPNANGLREELLGQGVSAFIQAARTPVGYGDLFRFGSGANLDSLLFNLEAIALQECEASDGTNSPACVIE